jgi:hypothetical protein
VLQVVRLRGAVFYYVSLCGKWSAEAVAANEMAASVMPGADHVIEYHMIATARSSGKDGSLGRPRHRSSGR